MNHFIRLLCVTGAAAALGWCGMAPASVVVDGYQWDHAYTGDALPTAANPVWTETQLGSGNTASVDSSGLLTINTPDSGNNLFFIQSSGAWAPEAGVATYVQFRMRADTSSSILLADGTHNRLLLWLLSNGGKTGVFGQPVDSSHFYKAVDYTQWHTYRIAWEPGNDSVDLWIDDFNAAPTVFSPDETAVDTNRLVFGDLGGNVKGTEIFDYVAWNNHGALALAPEPAMGALMLLGAGALMLRRRRFA